MAVSLCSFLAKKILSLTREKGDLLKNITFDKENRDKSSELRKLVIVLTEEKQKI
jgi:hypothetical protein